MSALQRVVDEPCLQDFDLESWLWEHVSARARQQLRALLEASMETELTLRLGYAPYRRDPELHTNYRNRYYERDLDTQFGAIEGRSSSGRMEDYYNRTSKALALIPSDE